MITAKEKQLIEKGYGLDKKCKTISEANQRKVAHQAKGRFSQTVKRKENNQFFWFVYDKK